MCRYFWIEHWIYWFYAQRQNPDRLYKFITAAQFWKEWQSNSNFCFWIKCKHQWITCVWYEKKMSRKLINYITTLHYTDKTLLVLSAPSSDVSLCSFATVVGAPIEIVRASKGWYGFLADNGFLKCIWNYWSGKEVNIEKLFC